MKATPLQPCITLVTWEELESIIRGIRELVFVREQGVPEELEWDGLDPACLHILARNDSGIAIGTARLQPEGKIGRMAVLKEWRGRGVGRAMLRALLKVASERGLTKVELAAQTQAIGFYEREGFRAIGEVFLDAGIPHRRMVLDLFARS
ncbi:MAG TPA: GNAT family N-acetyltransferase [Nitrospiraceae bacterium]|jgi:predicted GNAT family N-acyltransferase|nr:GNAT family N-acetyltransferase [Nitrospiraceae bacterium]